MTEIATVAEKRYLAMTCTAEILLQFPQINHTLTLIIIKRDFCTKDMTSKKDKKSP
jgi:hypothetical protein